MRLLNYDFYDLYALIIFFRADTDKVSQYTKALEQIVSYMTEPASENVLEFNTVRKILRSHVNETEEGLSWIWAENVYTGNVLIIKNGKYYNILVAIFQEMIQCARDKQRLWQLCDATHNIPTLLVASKKPKKIIKSMVRFYRKDYNKDFLVEELKRM